LENPAALQGFN